MLKLTMENVAFRAFRHSDAGQVALLLNDLRVTGDHMQLPYPYTESHAHDFIGQAIRGDKSYISLAIVDENDLVMGQVSLSSQEMNKGYTGYWIGHDYWGMGLASKALAHILKLAKQTGFVEVYGGCAEDNIASKKIMTKNGMKATGKTFDIPFRDAFKTLQKYSIQF